MTRMNLEDMVLSEISQTKKDTTAWLHVVWGPQSTQAQREKILEWQLPGAEESGEWGIAV